MFDSRVNSGVNDLQFIDQILNCIGSILSSEHLIVLPEKTQFESLHSVFSSQHPINQL